jgi:hypothetical protein
VKAREPLNIFFDEQETDRWVPYDRYPRGESSST